MSAKRPGSNRSSNRTVSTKSGKTLKVNQSMGDRWSSMKASKSRRKVDRLIGQPKSRLKRFFWKLQPKRLAEYWFSRDGGIMALKITGIAIIIIFIITLGVFAYFRKDLPDITDISGSGLGGSISYYDRTGKVLLFEDYNAVKRVPVDSSGINPYIKQATVAVEDRDFYKHRGFDIKGIARATYSDAISHSNSQGGSTITQQLVKLTQDWSLDRSLTRKAKELILAVELERTYTKDEILTGYLNAAPYGGVDYGVQAAAADYFRKDAKDLTLPEAAFLAAIPKSPSVYSPYNKLYFDKPGLIDRYHYVLDSMVKQGNITKAQADQAKSFDILATVQPQQTKYANIKSPYFVLSAKNQINSQFVPSNGSGSAKIGGWKVITTLDMKLQALADKEVQEGLPEVRAQGGDTAALVAEDVQTAQVVAVVGGANFFSSDPNDGHEINFAQQPVPPGSSFKPYDYTTLIENSSAGAGSVLYDVQQTLPGYPCTNKQRPPPHGQGNCLFDYDFRYPGPLTLRYAIGGSRNVPAVKAFLTEGSDKVINTAKSMGLRSGYKCYADQSLTKTTQCYGAAAIGDGAFLHLDEHVNGFATISRLGTYLQQTYILQIKDAASKTIYQWKPPTKAPEKEQVVKPDAAYIVANMLSDPNASYFPAYLKSNRYNGWNFAVKTGTTNDAKDGLLMGFSSKYAVGVWVGNHTRQVAMSGFMETMTRPIWYGFMSGAHAGLKPNNWKEPAGIQHLPAYVITSHVGIGSVEPSPGIEIYPSWYKPKTTGTVNATIDRVSSKLATDCTPNLAKQIVGGSKSAEKFSIDIFYGKSGSTGNSNTTASDDVHSCGDTKPRITLTVADGSNVCDKSCNLTATVSAGTYPLSDPARPQFPGTVNFMVNGQVVASSHVSGNVATVSANYKPTSGGGGTVSAQIIDSVLYDATDSKSVTFHAAGGGGNGGTISLSADSTGGTTHFSWSGGNGPYTVYKKNGNSVISADCDNTSSNSCTASVVAAPPGTKVYVMDSDGNTSPTVKVSGP